jgi:predicted nucleic acid-binding protein
LRTYIDSGALFALADRTDGKHAEACRVAATIATPQDEWVSGWHTLVEFADGLARRHGQAVATAKLEELVANPRLHVLPSEPHLEAARRVLAERTAWGVDLSDCLSFSLMRAHGIRRVFTFDSDFKKAGFQVVP